MLRDLIGRRAAEELVDAMEEVYRQLQILGWKEVRPWQDFFATFKLPQLNSRHLEQRMTTNFLHYRSNYFCICIGIVVLQILLAPMIIFAVTLVAALCTYLLFILKKPLIVGDIVLDEKKKMTLCAVFSLVLLVLTGTLERLMWCILYCITLCGLHMLFRPRSVTSKSNKVYEELKLNGYSWFGSSSTAGGSGSAVSNSSLRKPTGAKEPSYEAAPEDPERGTSADQEGDGKEQGFSSTVGGGAGARAMRKRGAAPSSTSAGGGAAVPSSAGGSSITGLYETTKKD